MLSLALLRHAKSSWADIGVDDHDRPLNERGRAAAPMMGGSLLKTGFKPQMILCSSAKRTTETLALALPAATQGDAETCVEHELYLAGPNTLLQRLRRVPPRIDSVLMIGHNPGMQALAILLASDAATRLRLGEKFPTAALALFTFPQPAWQMIQPETGQLTAFMTPRDRNSQD